MGYVGLVTASVLADAGNDVIGVDIDHDRIDRLNAGIPIIFEPGLGEMLSRNRQRLVFSDSYDPLLGSQAVFICVATPNRSGRINLDYVNAALSTLKSLGIDGAVAIKSTVVPGTATSISKSLSINIVSNPEFLREGSAVQDTLNPDRVVLGGSDNKSLKIFEEIWSFTNAPIVKTSNENAELIKYASNAFLATKISFINEIADLCEKVPTGDVSVVAEGIGYDRRISPFFLRAGLGYGGSCFPKDTRALETFANDNETYLKIVESAMSVNDERVRRNLSRIESNFGPVRDKKVCVLGLSFKDNTDDLRESKSWELIQEIKSRGGIVTAFDPVVKTSPNLIVAKNVNECVAGSDLIIVATEWEEFDKIELKTKGKIIDLRGILGPGKADLTVGEYA